MSALVVGTLLALAALAFVLWPLFDDRAGTARGGYVDPGALSAVDALREIEFDRETGKLSDDDYGELKASYTRAALDELRASDATAASGAATDTVAAADDAEAAVLRWRSRARGCPQHGARPEPDALYCSECGLYLDGKCAHCGAAVEGPGMRFCASCGHPLGAGIAA